MPEQAIRVIDIDGHVREADDLWQHYLEPPFRIRAPRIDKVRNGQLLFLLEGKRHHRKPDESPFRIKSDDSPVNEHRDLATDPHGRLKDMDRDGIERGMLFPSAALYLPSVEEEAYAVALCRAYNNWLYDYCGADRKRLMGVGVIPVQDINAAVAETRRVAAEILGSRPGADYEAEAGEMEYAFGDGDGHWSPGAPIRSRAEACQRLAEAADYLLRTEPHSPTPYLVRRAVEWGSMSLSDVLQQIVRNDGEMQEINRLLRLAPADERKK